MSKVTIFLPDDVIEKYQEYQDPAEDGKKLSQVLSDQLVRFKDCAPGDRWLLVSPELREKLEGATNQLPLGKAEDILPRIEELASIQIGSLKLHWTPAQLRELKYKADRWSMTVAQYLEANVRRVLEEHVMSTCPRPGDMMHAAEQAEGVH